MVTLPLSTPTPAHTARKKAAEPATPIAFVHAIVLAYLRYGADPSAALQKAHIAPSLLENPSGRISAWQMESISGAAMQELDDEALGWFSRRLPWGSYGMLARASLSAPSLGLALRRWCRHHRLITDDITLSLSIHGAVASITMAEHRDLGALREFCLVSVLRNVHGLACWLIDSRIPVQQARFPFPPPGHAQAYRVLFSGPTQFDAAHAAIQFDARYLSMAPRRDEPALQHMLQRALPLTVLQYRRDRLLVQRVRQAMAAHPEQTLGADDLSTLLHVSPRTLHRQLKEEGATLQGLKDEIRQTRAVDLLNRTDRPIKQIAEATGFQNEKSFIRAFKGWTGLSPGQFRRPPERGR
jgi:AraC-like DNA-binding protein